ncbi:MAG: hypothetical protein AN482_08625 [Anabaena sp. LE011-02]|nr:MAG: hypothetical protein AN482_08625 [Anabaena sp. LE011-02]
MKKYSESYTILKNQIQDSLNFVLLSCHAVPVLQGYIHAVETGKATNLRDPDYFQQIADHDRLKEIMPNYKKSLGKFLYITAFSYFEVYIKSVIEEFFHIHGGVENYLSYVKLKRDHQINQQNYRNDLVAKLRDSNSAKIKKGKVLKYKKAINELIQQGYMFPSQLLSVYGLNELKKELDNIKYMKAKDFIRVLNDVFGLEITEEEKTEFQQITDTRNKIAHGEIKEIDLSKAIKVNKFLRKLALKIDKHLITNFFVLENVDI